MTKTFQSLIRFIAIVLSVWNFGNSDLFEICILALGIFMILTSKYLPLFQSITSLNNVVPYGCHIPDSTSNTPGLRTIADGSMGWKIIGVKSGRFLDF
jgi:hypothetical protein